MPPASSAKTPEALRRAANSLPSGSGSAKRRSTTRSATRPAAGRAHFRLRLAVAATTPHEARAALRAYLDGESAVALLQGEAAEPSGLEINVGVDLRAMAESFVGGGLSAAVGSAACRGAGISVSATPSLV